MPRPLRGLESVNTISTVSFTSVRAVSSPVKCLLMNSLLPIVYHTDVETLFLSKVWLNKYNVEEYFISVDCGRSLSVDQGVQ